MHRFNLTFKGKIQPGYNPDKVKQRFAALLGIDNPVFLARCFSGESLVLRNDLDRKTAADLYRQLSKLGVVAELVPDNAVTQAVPHKDTTGAQEESRRQAEAARQRAAEEAARRARAEAEARAEARRREKEQAARRKAQAKAQAQQARAEAKALADAKKIETRTRKAQQRAERQRAKQRARAGAATQRAQTTAARTGHQPAPIDGGPTPAAPPVHPNPYALAPFRATTTLRERPRQARALMTRYLLLTTCALVALVAALLTRALLPQPVPLDGARAVAALHGGGLLLLTPDALLLHDRAGVGSESVPLSALGLSAVSAALALPESTDYLLVGRRESADNGEPPGPDGVWRCALTPPECAPFGPRGAPPAAQAAHPFTGMVLQAFTEPGRLRKLGAGGEEVAVADRALANPPSLLLRDGLLYSNSPDGPGLSVLRYEDEALGHQLDEILLLAPPALAQGRERVGDFSYLGEKWWAILHHPQTGDRGLYLFDDQWGFLRQLPLPAGFRPQQVLAWGQKLLVLDPEQPALQRFNSDGQAEIPLRSDLLEALISEGERARWLWGLLWQVLITALCLLAAGAAALSYLQHLRGQAFKPGHLRGAEPIEEHSNSIFWLDRSPERGLRLRRLTRLYLASACLALVAAIIARVDVHHMASLLVLLAGPAFALGLYLRSPAGHVGVLGDNLLLVDHRNTYHLGGGARILYHGWFLMIDDVLVHAGPAWAPAFPESQLEQWIVPMAQRGVRVDGRAVLARLVESRHPLALGAGIVLAAAVAAASIIVLY